MTNETCTTPTPDQAAGMAWYNALPAHEKLRRLHEAAELFGTPDVAPVDCWRLHRDRLRAIIEGPFNAMGKTG